MIINNSNLKERILKSPIKNKLANNNKRDLLVNLSRKMYKLGKVKASKSNIKVRIIDGEKGLTNWTKILNH
jgi:hypothetical protein